MSDHEEYLKSITYPVEPEDKTVSDITTEQMRDYLFTWVNRLDKEMVEAIRARLTEYDTLKAEVIKWKNAHDHMQKGWVKDHDRADKAEADLAAARPLFEAVKDYQENQSGINTESFKTVALPRTAELVLHHALAYRTAKDKPNA